MILICIKEEELFYNWSIFVFFYTLNPFLFIPILLSFYFLNSQQALTYLET